MARILLVYPIKGWAWHHFATAIEKYCPARHVPLVMEQAEYEATIKHGGRSVFGCHAAMHFSVQSVTLLQRCNVQRFGTLMASEAAIFSRHDDNDWRSRICVGQRSSGGIRQHLNTCEYVICPTPEIARATQQIHPICYLLPQGVDTELFQPRPAQERNVFRVGWCADTGGQHSVKGHDDILVPVRKAFDELATKDDITVEWQVNTRDVYAALSPHAMVDWYNRLDAFVCTSCSEGGPATPFEAAACGVPVISTGVGMVKHWAALRDRGFITRVYRNEDGARQTRLETVKALRRLANDDSLRRTIGAELRASVIQHYNWKNLAPRWLDAIAGDRGTAPWEASQG